MGVGVGGRRFEVDPMDIALIRNGVKRSMEFGGD